MNDMQEVQKTEEPEVPEGDSITESTGNFVSKALEKVLDLPGFSLLRPSLSSFLPVLAGNTLLALAAVLAPLLLGLLLLKTLFGGKRASSMVSCSCMMPGLYFGKQSSANATPCSSSKTSAAAALLSMPKLGPELSLS